MEIGAQPGVIGGQHLLDVTGGDDLAVGERGDAVADGIEAVEVVGDHEHRQAERLLQRRDELVEFGRADRIEAGGRLVKEQNLRVERQRAGEGSALDHAAGEFRGKFVGGIRAKAHHGDLEPCEIIHQWLRQIEIFAHGNLDVLGDGQAREQRAMLEQHAPASFHRTTLTRLQLVEILSKDRNGSRALLHEAKNGAGQH